MDCSRQVGSPAHTAWLTEAVLTTEPGIQVLGGVPKTADIHLPQRHLGLRTTEDDDMSSNYIQRLADLVEQHINLDAVLASAAVCEPLKSIEWTEDTSPCRSPTSPPAGKHVRIGIARDEVFCFYYQANLNLLEGIVTET